MVAASREVQITCIASPQECWRCYVARSLSGERHPYHFDGRRIARVLSSEPPLDWSRYAPRTLPTIAALLRVKGHQVTILAARQLG